MLVFEDRVFEASGLTAAPSLHPQSRFYCLNCTPLSPITSTYSNKFTRYAATLTIQYPVPSFSPCSKSLIVVFDDAETKKVQY